MRKSYLMIIGLLLLCNILFSAQAGLNMCQKVASTKLSQLGKTNTYTLEKEEVIVDQDMMLGYVFELSPQGYMVISADDNLPPVIAYSFTSNFYNEKMGNILLDLIKSDISLRLDNLSRLPESIISRRKTEWDDLLTEEGRPDRPEQWPPEGSTPTGGWLLENWTQSAPYNNFCPLDTVTGGRSIAGCPSIAMSQILNYHRTVNSVFFDDEDDYYHNYAGRQYWIDNDYQLLDFLSFPQINSALDSLAFHYQYGLPVSNDEKAALVFACGVAATQVYTSQASGTFGVSQAYDAFMKFNFDESQLIDESTPDFYQHIAQNIMEGLPVHFASVTPAWDSGHNFVVDGYNTDEFYHLNLGWGGTYNGWYLLPDEIPYGLTVVEGAIVDIIPPDPPVGFVSGQVTLEPAIVDTFMITVTIDNDYQEYTLDIQPDESGTVSYITQVSVGNYSVSATYPDYEFITYNNVLVEEYDNATVDFTLSQLIAPAELEGVLTGNEASLNWQHDSARAFQYYNIYRSVGSINNTPYALLDTTNQCSYIDTILFPHSSLLGYYITAVYAQENESHSSNTVYMEYLVPNTDEEIAIPEMLGNYPNPFNPSTTIYFSLENDDYVELSVYNLKGQIVNKLVTGDFAQGRHSIIWSGEDENENIVPSGLYLYKLKTDNNIFTRRMLLLK
ncbi:MAG: C10 family peptidase [Candidatus Stygibacter australis]|nr:C10 family peptidase [Candidatus Stygibacter australis]